MSISAKLFIEGHTKENNGIGILSFNFGFTQAFDRVGNIQSYVNPGLINLTIRGTEDPEIVNWMISNTRKNGRIEFSGFHDTQAKRRLLFRNGLLVEYNESFSDMSDIIISLSICATDITLSGERFQSKWSDTDLMG